MSPVRSLIRRALWAYVAACAAWRLYPRETTVVPNEDFLPMLAAYAKRPAAKRTARKKSR
jgi:hypothetical protein